MSVVLGAHHKVQAAERLAAGEDWVTGPHGGWVFAGPLGGPTDPRADLDEWGKLLAGAGVRYTTVHGARHTGASLALSDHVEARVIMARMGWSSSALLDRYQHPLSEADAEAAAAMNDALFGGTGRKPGRASAAARPTPGTSSAWTLTPRSLKPSTWPFGSSTEKPRTAMLFTSPRWSSP